MRIIVFSLLFLSAAALAQPARESYRVPFQAWRDAAPMLEQDAATPGPEFAGQLDAAARAAQTFLRTRGDYLTTGQGASAEQIAWAGNRFVRAEVLLVTPPETQQLLSKNNDYLTATINSFAGVRDPAIQQVRQAMERERAALTTLTEAVRTRAAASQELADANDDAEVARGAVAQSLANLTAARGQMAEGLRKEADGWAKYYRNLAEGAFAAPPAPSPGASVSSAIGPAPVKPAAPPRSVATLPLSRYTGAWTFPAKGTFFGAEPETAELVIDEANGRMWGTLSVRFKLPRGSSGDPNLQLTFQGLLQETRSQTFPVETAEGAGGTIELIPGPAFNLLEINLQTDPRPNKVSTSNLLLVKR